MKENHDRDLCSVHLSETLDVYECLLYIPLYRVNLRLIWPHDNAKPIDNKKVAEIIDWEFEVKGYDRSDDFDATYIRVRSKDNRIGCIFLRVWEAPDPYSDGDLAHEIGHLVIDILNEKGLEMHDSSEEAYTYMIGYVTRQFKRALLTHPAELIRPEYEI